VLDICYLSLQHLDCVLLEGGQDCKGAGESLLAEATVAHSAYNRNAFDSVSNGAASASAEMGVGH
jgi:hypothetical protein